MQQDTRFEAAFTGTDNGAFDEAVAKGLRRARAVKSRRRVMAASLAPVAAVMMMLLSANASPAIAMALGRVPLVRDLAKLVTFDKSLRLALENEYFQPVGRAEEKNGLTVNVGGIMADDGALTVFWDAAGDTAGVSLFPRALLKDNAGRDLPGTVTSTSDMSEDGTRKLRIILQEPALPDAVTLHLSFYSETANVGPVQAGTSAERPAETLVDTFAFDLSIDPSIRRKGDEYPVDAVQRLTPGAAIVIDRLAVYPTHARLFFHEDPANTEAVRYLSFTLTNEKGETFKSGTGMTGVYIMESSFFSNSGTLTLRCDRASTVPKDSLSVDIDPETGAVSGDAARWLLPLSVDRSGGVLRLSYTVAGNDPANKEGLYIPFTGNVTDSNGQPVKCLGDESHWDGDKPVYTLLLEDTLTVGPLHAEIGISPPVPVEAGEIRVK